jgi:outer membrane protein OmpA-like peptidoglycan-associated protein
MATTYFKIINFIFFIALSLNLHSQSDGYKYSLSQKIIATDFINSTNRDARLTALPRGIEIGFTKYRDSSSFFKLPIRVGFSRASNLDTFTSGKAFYGFDFQYGRILKGYFLTPFISSGIGLQYFNEKWDVNIPLNVGVEIPIDSAFALSLQTSYRHSFKKENITLQYGLGITFKIGKLSKSKMRFNNLPLKDVLDDSTSNGELVISRIIEGIDPLSLQKPIFLSSNTEGVMPKIIIPKWSPQELTAQDFDNYVDTNQPMLKQGLVPFGNIQFKSNSSEITDLSINTLKNLADKLILEPRTLIIIEGHTDDIGSDESNIILSQRRADVCKEHLKQFGIPTNRIKTKGWGEVVPLQSNKTASGRALNRRVEIYLLY